MKTTIIIVTTCIICFSCQKKDNGDFGYKFISHFTLDSSYSDEKSVTPNITPIRTISNPNNSIDFIAHGKVNTCLRLYGSTYLECTNLFSNFLTLEKTDSLKKYSISFWYKLNDISTGSILFGSNDRAGGGLGIYITDSLVLNYLNTNISTNHINKKFSPIDYNWNNIIITYNMTSFSLYFNGVEVYKDDKITKVSYLSSFTFGNKNEYSNIYLQLDDIYIWNYAISPSDVLDYYNSTK